MGAWIAGAFVVLMGLTMLAGHVGVKAEDPLKSPQLGELKAKLRLSPADEQIKRQVRELDLQLRQRYFRQLSRLRSGVWLMLGGVAVFIVGVTQAARRQNQPPMPQPNPEAAERAARAKSRARWLVAAIGAGLAVLLPSLGPGPALPKQAAESEKLLGPAAEASEASDAPSAQEYLQNWPRFRGPDGSGASSLTNIPVSWDAKTGAGIAWKTAAASGFGSPIVWGNRVFFSGGDASKREVFCHDAANGQLLWRQAAANVPGSPAQGVEVPDTTGYAASTVATDGRRVYAMFANGDLAAFSLEGKPAWSKSFGALKNPYGHATSLATWRDRLLVQLDQGESEEGKSKLYALDGRTGQIVWQRPRKAGSSWASPIVFEAAGKAQVVTLAVPWAMAYDAGDGTELWRVDCLNGEVTPSPIFIGGLVVVASPSDKLVAVRPDGQGDVTKSHVVWTGEDNVPDITSPTGDNGLVFTINSPGMLSCFDAKDGKKQWEHDFEMEFHASPALAGSRLYLFSQKGTAVVVEAARQFKELFRTEMGEGFHASPAFVPGGMILRGEKQLWRVGNVETLKR
jgi:outer membrane protein assembly factor BamB